MLWLQILTERDHGRIMPKISLSVIVTFSHMLHLFAFAEEGKEIQVRRQSHFPVKGAPIVSTFNDYIHGQLHQVIKIFISTIVSFTRSLCGIAFFPHISAPCIERCSQRTSFSESFKRPDRMEARNEGVRQWTFHKHVQCGGVLYWTTHPYGTAST